MSRTGPLEPGEGTSAREPVTPHPPSCRRRPTRTRLILATARAAPAVGGTLPATRPRPAPAPELPFPAQTVTVTFLGGRSVAPHRLASDVLLAVDAGPPVTVTRVSQPRTGMRAESAPRAPLRTDPGSPRVITVTMRVTECGRVPKNAGLPFLEVTLRNTRAIQTQSFILGPRYARHLSRALGEACGERSPVITKTPETPEQLRVGPAGSQHVDRANRPEFRRSPQGVPLCITSCHNKSVTALVRLSSTFPTHA